ncbi:MAG TPA: HAD-IIIA family hydrolase [Saprospiraceae bacterium]|nr:HAD-IIIA family hydrolase [Saprospiraceae bacterium]
MKNSHFLYYVDPSWTLFLDRDGVINRKIDFGYVSKISEFDFAKGAIEALYRLTDQFNRIIVVTNQQGIGKGIMTHDDLNKIHQFMLYEVENAHGRIDQIYYSADLDHLDSFSRKPSPGMAFQAQKDYPDINFEKSIMIGDSITDLVFGKTLGMKTVYIGNSGLGINNKLADLICGSLIDFAKLKSSYMMAS